MNASNHVNKYNKQTIRPKAISRREQLAASSTSASSVPPRLLTAKRRFRRKNKCSSSYFGHGHTSDPKNTAGHASNPYEELERSLQRQTNLRILENSMSWLTDRLHQSNLRCNQDGGGDDTNVGQNLDQSSLLAAANMEGCPFNNEDEEDDEDESGAPQAIRLPEQKGESTKLKTKFEVQRELRVSTMEQIVREVDPKYLLNHIRSLGYFNHNYDSHARRVLDSSTSGSSGITVKRDIDFLYSILGLTRPKKGGPKVLTDQP